MLMDIMYALFVTNYSFKGTYFKFCQFKTLTIS